jgi:hypothetical protein
MEVYVKMFKGQRQFSENSWLKSLKREGEAQAYRVGYPKGYVEDGRRPPALRSDHPWNGCKAVSRVARHRRIGHGRPG